MEDKVTGKEVLLFIDPAGGTDYDTLVCLTQNDWKGTTNVIDAVSKCGPDSRPGTQANSISFEGQHLINPESGKISGADLFDLWQNSTTIGWKIAKAIPVDGDEILEGTGFISDLTKAYPLDNVVTYAGTLSIYGDTTQSIEGES